MDTLQGLRARSQIYLTPESSYSPVTVFSSFSDEPEKGLVQEDATRLSLENSKDEISQRPKDKRYVFNRAIGIALRILLVASLMMNVGSNAKGLSRSPFAGQDGVSKDAALFPGPHETFASNSGTTWVRPAELKVIGIIFCALLCFEILGHRNRPMLIRR